MDAGFGPITQTYLRIGIGFFLALILFSHKISFKKLQHISMQDWFLLTLIGTIGYGIAVIFITLAVLHTTFLNVAVIASTSPFFALLLSILFLRKTISPMMFGFLSVSFTGVYLITTKTISPVITQFGIGEVYALMFAFGIGVFAVARKLLSKNLNNYEISIIVMGIAFISSLIGALLIGEEIDLAGFANPTAMAGLAIGSILNVSTTFLTNYGFGRIGAVAGAQILLLQNVFAPIIGFLLYNEMILPIEFIGAGLIVAGVFGYNKLAAD